MEIELDFKLFGFSINNYQLRRDQPPPPPVMQEQEPHQPSSTLSLSIQPSIPAMEIPIPNPRFKLFGAEINTDVPVKPKIKRPRLRPPVPQYLPFMYRKCLLKKGIDDNTLKLVFIRTLHTTDMNPHHARLSIPCKQVKAGFLTHEEEEFIQQSFKNGARDLYRKLDVTVVDPSFKFHKMMKLTKWNNVDSENTGRKKSWWYALTNDWIKLARDNQLAVGVAIQLWSFRFPNGALGFLIHKIDPVVAG